MSRVPQTDVPPGEEPAARCPYCDRPFRTAHLQALHIGEVHADRLTADERESYEAALEYERDELFAYQLRVVIALGVIYAIMVILLMVILGGGL